MNLRPDDLPARLKQALAPLWIVHGNELLVLEAADAIRAAARSQGFDERETLVVDTSFRWDALMLAAGNLSLFGGSRLIDLRIPTGKPGKEGGETLQRYAAAPPAGIVTLITLPVLDWQTRKTVWYKAITEAGLTLEYDTPPRERLPAWIATRLAAQGQSAPAETLEFIADHVEGNLLAAQQEIRKLGLLHGEGALTQAEVEAAVLNVARYDTNMLRQALVEGDPARCIRLLDGLHGESVPPPLVLWAFTSEIRTLAALRGGSDMGQPLPTLFKAERIFDPARQRSLRTALARLTRPALSAALLHAARIDRTIKGLARGEVWDEFQHLALRLCRRGA
ncbi:MAG: DNA polymerase III subunit delta [Azoarcus sp.]|jgi:DNA polymerase-3 subunit delta|nr:DNA polymerase III subunit delta [Azoarcus sp.]